MKEITIYKNFDDLKSVSVTLYKSGYFTDVRSEAQAMVKVMAGAELGLPAFASMAGIHIISGKPVLGANVIATLVKNDPRYDYRIKRCDNEACILEWFENGKAVGESSFIIQEAHNITAKENQRVVKLSETTRWRSYPSDMLFARAISRGARRFAPGIFGGSPVYTPDEMNVEVDEEGYIDASYSDVSEPEPVSNEQILDELGYDVEPEPMTVERACAVENSEGVLYGDLPASKLSAMTLGINKGLAKKDLTEEDRQVYLMKLEAIKVLLRANEAGEITLKP